MKKYYDILNLNTNATQDEIKSAYRNLSKKYHPDINKDKNSENKFKEIKNAYEILTNKSKSPFQSSNNSYYEAKYTNEVKFDFFNDLFTYNDSYPNFSKPPGTDSQIKIEITLEESFNGCRKKIDIDWNDVCNKCNGNKTIDGSPIEACGHCSGNGYTYQRKSIGNNFVGIKQRCFDCQGSKKSSIYDRCTSCNGRGFVKSTKNITVDIPAGTKNEHCLIIKNYGLLSEPYSYRGSLIVNFEIKKHDLFTVEGFSLRLKFPLYWKEALLGGEIEFPTLKGSFKQKFEPFICSGEKVVLPGLGLLDPSSRKTGDFILEFTLETPKIENIQNCAISDVDLYLNKTILDREKIDKYIKENKK